MVAAIGLYSGCDGLFTIVGPPPNSSLSVSSTLLWTLKNDTQLVSVMSWQCFAKCTQVPTFYSPWRGFTSEQNVRIGIWKIGISWRPWTAFMTVCGLMTSELHLYIPNNFHNGYVNTSFETHTQSNEFVKFHLWICWWLIGSESSSGHWQGCSCLFSKLWHKVSEPDTVLDGSGFLCKARRP